MNNINKVNNERKQTVLIQEIKQENINIKNVLNITLLLGSIGFLIVGISSYLNKNIIEILDATKILFFPQGLTMSIYGFLGLCLSTNQILITSFKIGEGFNEFNKETNAFKIFRKKSFSENIELIYPINDIVRNINLKF